MYDIKRRYQNVEQSINESMDNSAASSGTGAHNSDYSSRDDLPNYRTSSIREQKLTSIKHNIKNIHLLAYFVIVILIALFTVRVLIVHYKREDNGSESSKMFSNDLTKQAVDATSTFYGLDFSYLYGALGEQRRRDMTSKLPSQLASTSALCDFDRQSEEVLNSDIFDSKYRNKKPFILFFYSDSKEWSYPTAWRYSSLNSTYKDTIIQFGRSVDSDEQLRETTFSNFITNLIGQTDLRGEPWQIRDVDFIAEYGDKLIKKISFFPDEWKSLKSVVHIGTTLASTSFAVNPSGSTLLAMVKGRTRVFVYPTTITPPAGYDHETDMLSWFTSIYPKVTEQDGEATSLSPLECIIEAGEILYIPEAWFWATINIGTAIKVVYHGQKPLTPIGEKLSVIANLYATSLGTDTATTNKMNEEVFNAWGDLEKILPDSNFVQFEKSKLLVKMGKPEEALNIFTSLGDYFVMARVEAARLIRDVFGNAKESLALLNATLKVAPQSDVVLRDLAYLYHDEGNYEMAGLHFRKAALLSSQIEQQMEDLSHAEENYKMAAAADVESSKSSFVSVGTNRNKGEADKIQHLKQHFKDIAHNEYTQFKN